MEDQQKRLDRENQAEHEAQLQRFAAIIAVVVSIFSVGSLFPALAAIPRRGEDTLLGGWVVPAVITGVLMLLVMLLGALLHKGWTRKQQKKAAIKR
jgi:protein-S-isoprenylcysteine O-methyltransferase Ste14